MTRERLPSAEAGHSRHDSRRARALARGALLATAALLLVAACGGSGGGSSEKGTPGSKTGMPSKADSPSPTATAGPMAKMPAGTDAGLKRKGELSVCKGAAEAPFMAQNSSTSTTDSGMAGQDSGFDVDMLVLIGKRIGAQPVVSSFSQIEQILNGQALNEKVCDIVAGLSEDSPKSFPEFASSTGYFDRDQAILAKSSATYPSLASLAGKRVGALQGATSPDDPDDLDKYNSKHGNAIKVQRLPDTDQAVDFLLAGRLDAVVLGNGEALNSVVRHSGKGLHVTGEFGGHYQEVFAVRKGNTALLKQVNAALADAGKNGQYAQSYRRWFGIEPPSLPK